MTTKMTLESAKQKLEEIKSSAEEGYSNNPVLKGAIGSIPYVGSIIDNLLSAEGIKQTQENLHSFLKLLLDAVTELERNGIDLDYMQSPEFNKIICQVVEKASITFQDEILQYYTKILSGLIKLKGKMDFYPEHYLWAISNLRAEEFNVLNKIYEKQNPGFDSRDLENEGDWVLENGWEELENNCCSPKLWFPIIVRLMSFGLIRHAKHSKIYAKRHICVLTEFGRDLMTHLSQSEF